MVDATLHLLQTANGASYKRCRQLMQTKDALVLMGEGVYCLSHIADNRPATIYLLTEDCAARGLSLEDTRATAIDYEELVTLVTTYQKTLSWC